METYSWQRNNQPYKAYRFLIEIEGNGAVVGAFTQFSGIGMTNQTASFRSGDDVRGVKDNIPGITEYEHVRLTKGVIGDNEFLNWLFQSTFPGNYTGPQGRSTYRNLNIVALSDSGERGVVWTLQNAIPVGYRLEQMDASQSTVMTEVIEFAITGVQRVVSVENRESALDYKARLPMPGIPLGLTEQLRAMKKMKQRNSKYSSGYGSGYYEDDSYYGDYSDDSYYGY